MDEVKPQAGPQWTFLTSPADIAVYGGAAGSGKSFALLMECMRHLDKPRFSAALFRRNLTDVVKPGALWDSSFELFPAANGKPIGGNVLEWRFPSGAKAVMGHLEHEKTVLSWQGSQIPLLCFDELTHFSRNQFFYMLSRNRSTCGIKPYVRCTTNPDPDSWVAEFLSWWIDQDTGYPVPERSGVIRWFQRVGDKLHWADSQDELRIMLPELEASDFAPKSVTFISAKLEDNQILMNLDPGYRANLLSLSLVDRERLLGGNWKIRPAAGLMFRREWCEVVDAAPANISWVRGWDLAGTPKTDGKDPDWTVGAKIGRSTSGIYYIAPPVRLRDTPGRVEEALKNTASADGVVCTISIPQDPGQAGKSQVAHLAKVLSAFHVKSSTESGDKLTRFKPFSAQCEAGNVKILRSAYSDDWLGALEAFPDGLHDDDADAISRAYNALAVGIAPVVAPSSLGQTSYFKG